DLSKVKQIPVSTQETKTAVVYTLMYVDDLMLCCEYQRDIKEIISNLNKEVEIKQLGQVSYYLGIQIDREEDESFLLSQKQKILDLVENLGMQDANPVHTSMETGFYKQKELSELLPNNQGYREVIGKQLYLASVTRADIAAAVGILCRRTSSPTQRDWNGIKRVVKYLKCTAQFKLKLPSTGNTVLVGFTDADWTEDISDQRSTSGYVFFYGGGPINSSYKQGSIAHSSTEAEYILAAAACHEIVWLKLLLADLNVDEPTPVTLYEDNQSCIIRKMSNIIL
ncbi:hypothetical protein JRQ81_015413, partial [Phrynocephalus forsythii]